jgi:hypothetical protein
MKKSELRQIIKEEISKVISEQGPDLYIGKYMGKYNMYKDDEGNTYIKDKKTNWVSVSIRDAEGNKRDEKEIKADIQSAFDRLSDNDFKKMMRGY